MSAKEGAARLKAATGGDFSAFAKLLTWIERAPVSQVIGLPGLLKPKRPAFRCGITGPPGAGKSTLVAGLIREFRARDLRVGVIAVDPSSPFSQGAILGDRIRYTEHSVDPGVFIRSLGTRGSLGGLSSAAFLMARAFDLCGFDILLIETVGVGQTELDVLHVADQVSVVLVPESGDSIQAMKAGLMEIADLFVVNKSDRPGADGLAREISAAVHDGEAAREIQVIKCTASEGAGVAEVTTAILNARDKSDWFNKRSSPARLRAEGKALLRRKWEDGVDKVLAKVKTLAAFQNLLRR